jgi:hypothetical protein
MASIVLGIGASHTPMLALRSEHWSYRAQVDYANPRLNLADGREMNYDAVLAELGPRCADVISPEILQGKAQACQDSLDRLADEIAATAPDIVVIIGDDQRELFTGANQPAICVFHGAEIVTSNRFGRDDCVEWEREVGREYMMDKAHVIPGASGFALELVRGLLDENFDVAASDRIDDPADAGVGHAFGFIVKRLFRGRAIPVVPILINTFYGPNVPSAARCHDFGQALARIIAGSPSDARVAVIGSGGLSHFVVDEELDRGVLRAFETGDHAFLRAVPRRTLISGTSEILNWIALAGAVQPLPLQWKDYYPLYRTPAGTGTGAAFAVWRGA